MSTILGLCSALECPNLISSNSFAHKLGTRNFALRLTPGPVCDGPKLRHRRSAIVRRKRNVPALSFLELQRERRETTELGYPGRCWQQPPETHGPYYGPPVAKSLVYGPGPGSSWETGLHHHPGLILIPAVPHTWAPPGPGQVFFYRSAL